jgi:hypothetical protein
MTDELGRGMVDWPAERWLKLDENAATSVGEVAVFRNLVDVKELPGAFSARIAGTNVDVKTIGAKLTIDMENDDDEDIDRKIRLAGQSLGVKEDGEILKAMNFGPKQQSARLDHNVFIKAKNDLLNKGVQHGLGVVVSSSALNDLESELVGALSGLDVAERLLGGAKVLQSNSLDSAAPEIEAVLVQHPPAAYRLVRGWGPRLRVLKTDGKRVDLLLEEGIAVGELEKNRCVAIGRIVAPATGEHVS